MQQRQEISPLFVRGVLKLVDHKVLVTITNFLVDKRGIVILDKFREYVFGLRQQHHSLLFAARCHLGVEVGQQCVVAICLAEELSGVVASHIFVIDIAQLHQKRLQFGDQILDVGAARRGFSGPFTAIDGCVARPVAGGDESGCSRVEIVCK